MKGKRKKPNFYFSFKIISHLFRGFRGYTGVQGGSRRKEAKARWGGGDWDIIANFRLKNKRQNKNLSYSQNITCHYLKNILIATCLGSEL